ncbi:MAG: methyltransferase domain-containing protein [Clostridia bacterium]|nr:methyltransferase domain-containing protein [Clostridia bacterium]
MDEARYDVFISFKNKDKFGNQTEDSRIAAELYKAFVSAGVSAFYSNVKLLEFGSATYKRSIEQALESARVMVVLATDLEYLATEWVTYERESFHEDILSGRKKNACIIPYLVATDGPNFPRCLRGYETFLTGEADINTVVSFALAFLKGGTENQQTAQKALTTGKTLSTYRPTGGHEFRRLEIQARNTKPADMPAIRYAIEHMPPRKLKILDVGCAYGYVTADRFGDIEGATVIGVDVADKCLEYARANNSCGHIVYEHLQLEDEELENNLYEIMRRNNVDSFDIIFASLVIHHLKNPNKFLKRIRKFLAKDGFIIIRGSDDGSVIGVGDDGLIDKIIQMHLSCEGISDRKNGRKIYAQLMGSGYKNVLMMNYVKEISGLDIDERNDVFEERFAYRRNYLQALCDRNPYDIDARNNLECMDFALECLENKFSEDAFWYCEVDFVGVAQRK